jgi:hypothetical protein
MGLFASPDRGSIPAPALDHEFPALRGSRAAFRSGPHPNSREAISAVRELPRGSLAFSYLHQTQGLIGNQIARFKKCFVT